MRVFFPRPWLSGPLLLTGLLLILAAWIPGPLWKRGLPLGLLQSGLLVVGVGLIGIVRCAPRWIPQACLFVSGLGMAFVSVEVAVRMVCPIPPVGSAEWASSPGSKLTLTSTTDHFQAIHQYNALGFRGKEIPHLPGPKSRVVCIGDSWTEGIGAEENQSWPAVLERESNFEVINLGDSGSQPDRYLEILANVGLALRPSKVIVCVIPSDLIGGPYVPAGLTVRTTLADPFRERGNWLRNGWVRVFCGWSYLWDRSQGRWVRYREPFWSAWDSGHETAMLHGLMTRGQVSRHRAEQLLSARRKEIDPACLEAAHRREFNGARIVSEVVRPYSSYACRIEDMEIACEDLVESTMTWVRWYAERCREQQVTPFLLFFPEAGLVSDAPVGPMSDAQLDKHPRVSGDNSLSQLLAMASRECGVGFIDVTPVLRDYRGPKPLFLRYDGHPTATAYELVGKHLAAHPLLRTSP